MTRETETVEGEVVAEQLVTVNDDAGHPRFAQLINHELELTLPGPGRYKVVRVDDND